MRLPSQLLFLSLLPPVFAASSISGEKGRGTSSSAALVSSPSFPPATNATSPAAFLPLTLTHCPPTPHPTLIDPITNLINTLGREQLVSESITWAAGKSSVKPEVLAYIKHLSWQIEWGWYPTSESELQAILFEIDSLTKESNARRLLLQIMQSTYAAINNGFDWLSNGGLEKIFNKLFKQALFVAFYCGQYWASRGWRRWKYGIRGSGFFGTIWDLIKRTFWAIVSQHVSEWEAQKRLPTPVALNATSAEFRDLELPTVAGGSDSSLPTDIPVDNSRKIVFIAVVVGLWAVMRWRGGGGNGWWGKGLVKAALVGLMMERVISLVWEGAMIWKKIQ